jgi:hypothetical protein
MLFELSGLKRLAYLMDCNNQQFIDSPRLVKMYDQEGVDSWKIAQPDDILGEWDYRPSGSNIDPAANKEMRRQQLTQLMQVGVQMPWVNPYALFKLWLESFDLRNVNQILLTPEQMQQQQQQQMLQQLLLQNQQQSQSPPGTQPGMGR